MSRSLAASLVVSLFALYPLLSSGETKTTLKKSAAETTPAIIISAETRSASTRSTAPKTLKPPADVILKQNVPYLPPDRKEKLDVYYAADRPKDRLSPAIVLIHGGGWVGGNKAARREFGAGVAFARAGYVAVSVEYQKEEGKRWPTNLHDCKNAVRWVRANAKELQVDPQRIGVLGGSAGGHLALMVAYTAGVRELEPSSPYPDVSNEVQACVNLYGITNLLTRQSTERDGTPNGHLRSASALFPESREQASDKWQLASPVFHVGPGSPPTLILHGTSDTTVDRDQAYELARKLEEHGVEHKLTIIPCAPHAFTLDDRRLPRDLRPEVIQFFDIHLKEQSKP